MPEKSEIAKKEEKTLAFWRENKIFEKTLAKDSPRGEYIFYDGPPFATGTPHYGHILGSTVKDMVPRYKTMRGYHVERRWGWDCHGLPIENIAEKDLKISGKKQIEEIGVKKFNEHARSKVLEFINDWKLTVERMGRWVNFDDSYKTMDNSYMESVWWAIKQMNEKASLYEGTRVLPYCPRCETPIANSEIAMDNSYKDIADLSVTVKFELEDEPGTYVLAWTTTPWTLPGNVALAVNPEINYVLVTGEGEGSKYIVAESRAEAVSKNNFKISKQFKGAELVGKKYRPLFEYFKNAGLKDAQGKVVDKDKAWRIYGADFVTTEDGTGVVHIAPAFGEDDMNLAKKENLPIIKHVDGTGRFTAEVTDFAGQLVKPKTDDEKERMQADINVIKYFQDHNLFFDKQKITHSYPHCFRCETPLYYYAIPAWFIDIQKIKAELLNLNEKINWVPAHLKEGRFKNSVEGAPDWNISRNRYWATPLPIWKCEECRKTKILGAVEELQKAVKNSGNKYFLMRHGEASANLSDLISCGVGDDNHLTPRGEEEVKKSATKLKSVGVDLIFSSDLVRTKETAELLAKDLGLSSDQVIFDKRLREWNVGEANGHTWKDFSEDFNSKQEKLVKVPLGGESVQEVKNRVSELAYELEEKYQDKKIVIVSHGLPLFFMIAGMKGLSAEEETKLPDWGSSFKTAEVKEVNFKPLPHNDNYELDLHRPYIDEIKLLCDCDGEMKRITEVVDCWLESGSMPFAANHYPFENKEKFESTFPAQFIAEYIAQTRTWFYYMHVMSTALFHNISYENVVTTGTVLAEDGQKMSKSKGNFPDPQIIFDRYGVDALRFYLISSPLMKAEDLFFSEKGVAETSRKVISRLLNVYAFYEMYADSEVEHRLDLNNLTNVLDRWVVARLQETIMAVEKAMEAYELDRSTRPIDDFIDDLSNWYTRRSRERFKSEDKQDRMEAIAVTNYVLKELAKIMAPVTPFVADYIYRQLRQDDEPASVHLCDWPAIQSDLISSSQTLLREMNQVRATVSLGLEARMSAGIKVRQPLALLKIKTAVPGSYFSVIEEELNVKKVVVDQTIEGEVWLETEMTEELIKEGQVRDFIRQVQDLRKRAGLNPGEVVSLVLAGGEEAKELISAYQEQIKGAVSVSAIDWGATEGEEIKFGELSLQAELKR